MGNRSMYNAAIQPTLVRHSADSHRYRAGQSSAFIAK